LIIGRAKNADQIFWIKKQKVKLLNLELSKNQSQFLIKGMHHVNEIELFEDFYYLFNFVFCVSRQPFTRATS